MKIIVIGSPGAGKSYFSRQLSKKYNIPLYHLDNIYWNEDKTHLTREELQAKVESIIQTDNWIIDGNYISTMEQRISAADEVILFDCSTEICIDGIKSRIGTDREDLPWIEEELDLEFLEYVKEFKEKSLIRIEEKLSKYPEKKIVRFTTRQESDQYLNNIKTLYITDLDGTLLNRQTTLSDYTKNNLNALIENGVMFTYATARSINSASQVAEGLNVRLPVITYNGTFIVDPVTKDIIDRVDFTKNEIADIIAILRNLNISPMVSAYIDGRERISYNPAFRNAGKENYLKKRTNDERMRMVDEEKELYKGDVFHFTCIGEYEELKPLYERLEATKAFYVTFYQELYSDEYWLEIMPFKATKANAIIKLKNMLGCQRLVVFGDGLNDISMFEVADEGYAVENAVEELKEIATGIIKNNEEDGVVKYIQTKIQG